MGRKLISVFLAVCALLLLPVTAFAQDFDPERTGSITVTLLDPQGQIPLAGAEFSVYYVATANLNSSGKLQYAFTEEFARCGCALEDPELSVKLAAFVQEQAAPVAALVTDDRGYAEITQLPLGLYLLKQNNTVAGYARCTAFLVTVPSYGEEGFVYDVNASPKTDVTKLTAIGIKKVWNTDESDSVADSVTVQLKKDGIVIATAVLNDRNKWQIVYTDMPESDAYTIVEVDVPKGFVATYSQNGYLFTVTNSAFLIQTGQPVWPIPVLALVGLCLIALGTVVLRKTRGANG